MKNIALIAALLQFAAFAGTDGWSNINPERSYVAVGDLFWKADLSRGIESFEIEKRNGAEGEV